MMIAASLHTAVAQQGMVDKRSQTAFEWPEFRSARIYLADLRFVRTEANVFLKNSTLCYMDKDRVMELNLGNVLSIDFDSVQYLPLQGKQVARVVAVKDGRKLLRLRTIDLDKLRSETQGGDNLPFFEIEDLNVFMEIDGDKEANVKQYPLRDRYYYMSGDKLIEANETKFKKHLKPELREKFRETMLNKYWSWSDEHSLTLLLDFIKD